MTHSCIKCKTPYVSEDADPYLCEACIRTRKQIAAEIDAKFANRKVEHPVSRFTEKDLVGKNGRIFFSAKDLGI